jgi:hypothetical protein
MSKDLELIDKVGSMSYGVQLCGTKYLDLLQKTEILRSPPFRSGMAQEFTN